jgi:malate synthase
VTGAKETIMTAHDNSMARSNPAPLIKRRRLQVAKVLHDFINDEVLPGTGVPELEFWAGFDTLLHNLAPENRALLAKRDRLQAEIDAWHRDHAFEPFDAAAYREFLAAIGYLCPDVADFTIATAPLDAEMSTIAGPQLVVPLTNARYALNAANARWGSLYDAVYGTDMIPGTPRKNYDPVRGAQVIGFARDVSRQGSAARQRLLYGCWLVQCEERRARDRLQWR